MRETSRTYQEVNTPKPANPSPSPGTPIYQQSQLLTINDKDVPPLVPLPVTTSDLFPEFMRNAPDPDAGLYGTRGNPYITGTIPGFDSRPYGIAQVEHFSALYEWFGDATNISQFNEQLLIELTPKADHVFETLLSSLPGKIGGLFACYVNGPWGQVPCLDNLATDTEDPLSYPKDKTPTDPQYPPPRTTETSENDLASTSQNDQVRDKLNGM